MRHVNQGGSAFPHAELHDEWPRPGARECRHLPPETGMTLRDYFAAALSDEPGDNDYSDVAKAALIGRAVPSLQVDGPLAVLEFEAEFRAKWRLMRAEAMIRARGEA